MQPPTAQNKLEKGFTLIELLIVMALIGAMATVVVISYTGAQKRARDAKRMNELSQYQNLLEAYASNNQNRFVTTSGSQANVTNYCADLNSPSCPDDPDTDQNYMYQTDVGGTRYVLWAQLEAEDEIYVACSSGVKKKVPGSWEGPSDGNCP